jgi:PTS system, glucose subfamily, IIA component
MFHFRKKVKDCNIYSPIIGKMIALENVKDHVFSSKMMGDGCAFEFDGDTVFAPCNGEIVLIANTKHAIGLKAENGTEIMIHIGLDTVNLNGEGFEVCASVHDKVNAHDPLIRINRQIMRNHNIDLTMPMVITNMSDYEVSIQHQENVNLDHLVMVSKRK